MSGLLGTAAEIATVVLGAATVGTFIGWAGTKVFRGVRRVRWFLDDFEGTPARDGVPERPGVMRRLAGQDELLVSLSEDVSAIKAELPKNGVPLAHKMDALWKEHQLRQAEQPEHPAL